MANNKDFKVKNSIKPTAYHEGVGPATSGTAGPDGLFSTTLYETNFASNTVTTGIDGTGSSKVLYWAKPRVDAAQDNNALVDNVRQTSSPFERLTSNTTDVPTSSEVALGSFTSTGFTLGQAEYFNGNLQGNNSGGGVDEVVWGFKAASNFFDIVTYTGNGSTQNISHNLGSVPGTIIVKKTNSTANWLVYHRSLGNDKAVFLNLSSSPSTSSTYWNATTPTSSVFSVGANSNTNGNGDTFVAYLFAHDESSSSMIKCGSYDGQATVDLGWEPQWILFKNVIASSSWRILDTERGIPVGTGDLSLAPDRSDAEISTDWVDVNSTGFEITTTNANVAATNGTGTDGMIYVAIRKVVPTETLDLSTGAVFDVTPTSDSIISITNPAASGTVSQATLLLTGAEATGIESIFSTDLYTGTSSTQTVTTGVDLSTDGGMTWIKNRGVGVDHTIWDTERTGRYRLESNTTAAQEDQGAVVWTPSTTGFSIGGDGGTQTFNTSANTYVAWSFKKQAKFFDVVTYTGTGSAKTIAHNLGVAPGCVIVKSTTNTEDWVVYHRSLGGTYYGKLNATDQFLGPNTTVFNGTDATDSVFSVGTNSKSNGSGQSYVAYLFAHDTADLGLIKCGSYTGNGSTSGPTITLGWEPQWLLLKNASTGSTGWIIVDAERNLGSGNDYILQPQSTGVEITNLDYYTPSSTGFQVVTTSDGANTNGDTYIYVAIRSTYFPTLTYDNNIEWAGGTAPTSPGTDETDVITFSTRDGGTTYQGSLAIDGAK